MKFVAFERAKQGTGASRRLRNTGKTPGIVYGGEGQPQLIELDHNALWHALKREAFHSTILEMEVAGKTSKVLLRDVQMHPFKQLVQHIDFQRVDARTKLHMKVPLHYKNAEESQAVKFEHCVVNHVMSELNISCLPGDLPEFIEVDLSGLKKGTSLHLNDIQLPKGVNAVTGGKKNPVLVSVVATVAEEAPAADAAAAAPAADAKAAPAKAAPAKAAGKDAKAAAPAPAKAAGKK
ncbi:50S ribosomal protein L25/general stress protein Ctc [Ramlibacter tataouinensis]|uniref:Large ribosomal subunit protein bL25 n=1 Tax=Ramlibacter tataouinensis (strain ATCC BAA-407 / DSM 14655 / LMG 21543 / TTB310) TaxID=365046 RepID=F5XYS5_RAMTT|nr:50S ribosomal protein L25/general stress protein Ctc [Ramlibacter tataouinensis]AEG94442.1 50S ribosomal protein L25-like protein [Ramlibacter tataouinensis TTB310]